MKTGFGSEVKTKAAGVLVKSDSSRSGTQEMRNVPAGVNEKVPLPELKCRAIFSCPGVTQKLPDPDPEELGGVRNRQGIRRYCVSDVGIRAGNVDGGLERAIGPRNVHLVAQELDGDRDGSKVSDDNITGSAQGVGADRAGHGQTYGIGAGNVVGMHQAQDGGVRREAIPEVPIAIGDGAARGVTECDCQRIGAAGRSSGEVRDWDGRAGAGYRVRAVAAGAGKGDHVIEIARIGWAECDRDQTGSTGRDVERTAGRDSERQCGSRCPV